MNLSYLKSLLYVCLAASSYGLVATFVRLAYNHGYTTGEVVISQMLIGLISLIFIHKIIYRKEQIKHSTKDKYKLIICGTSFGLTSTFYYLAVHYKIPVSICIVLLMQAVWMGAFIDFIVNKKKPSLIEIISIFLILIGTVLATNLINDNQVKLNPIGLSFGILAAISYTCSMYSSNKIGTQMSPILRSVYLFMGSTILVSLIWGKSILQGTFNFTIFYQWGIICALFGAILPTILFTKGMPVVGIGIGSILASLELPISVLMAKFILNENVYFLQWIGIVLILISIVLLNLSFLLPKNTKL
ncbi:EamA/RhaT family transporter [Apibacter muscae]|uniref:EamA family transporter n=1 Tax=Apibacter muscae TaxID=2509004 RepID=UPI0011AD03E1|nr:DMT family transporter [Apibacter muscae]TWP22940.1 EamA/RhaT family transporter [Apibacter muscae]